MTGRKDAVAFSIAESDSQARLVYCDVTLNDLGLTIRLLETIWQAQDFCSIPLLSPCCYSTGNHVREIPVVGRRPWTCTVCGETFLKNSDPYIEFLYDKGWNCTSTAGLEELLSKSYDSFETIVITAQVVDFLTSILEQAWRIASSNPTWAKYMIMQELVNCVSEEAQGVLTWQ